MLRRCRATSLAGAAESPRPRCRVSSSAGSRVIAARRREPPVLSSSPRLARGARSVAARRLEGSFRRYLAKHEGSFYPWPRFLELVAFFETRGPLGRLNARYCGCRGGTDSTADMFCPEEWYLATLYRRLYPSSSTPGRDVWAGSVAARLRKGSAEGGVGVAVFADKDWRRPWAPSMARRRAPDAPGAVAVCRTGGERRV